MLKQNKHSNRNKTAWPAENSGTASCRQPCRAYIGYCAVVQHNVCLLNCCKRTTKLALVESENAASISNHAACVLHKRVYTGVGCEIVVDRQCI